MSTADIDKLVYDYTVSHGAIPAPLNYEGFPKSVCTSINEVVCHGIPSEFEVLEEGDIINVDVSTILDGYYSDASRMFIIGKTSPEKEKLVRVTKECLEIGAEAAKPWGFVGDIGKAIESMPRRMVSALYATYADMVLELNFTKNQKLTITTLTDMACYSFLAWCLPSNQ